MKFEEYNASLMYRGWSKLKKAKDEFDKKNALLCMQMAFDEKGEIKEQI